LRQNFKKAPETCKHNECRYLGAEQVVGVCCLSTDLLLLCDSGVEGANQAPICPNWMPLRTKNQIKEDFRFLVRSGERGRIAAKYPDVVAMMWVLDDPILENEFKLVEDQFDLSDNVDVLDLWKKGSEE
jgi:hypothetical protein